MKSRFLFFASLIFFIIINCKPELSEDEALPPVVAKKKIEGNISYTLQSDSTKFSFKAKEGGTINIDFSKLTVDGEPISKSDVLALKPVFSTLDDLPSGITLDSSTGAITINNTASVTSLKSYKIFVSIKADGYRNFASTLFVKIEITPIPLDDGLVYAKKEVFTLTSDTVSYSFSSDIPKSLQNKSYYNYEIVAKDGFQNLPNNIELDSLTGDIKVNAGAFSSSNEYKVKAIIIEKNLPSAIKDLPEVKAFVANYSAIEGKVIIVLKVTPITAGSIEYNNGNLIFLAKGHGAKYSPSLIGVVPKSAESVTYVYQFLTGGKYSPVPNGVSISSSTGEVLFRIV